MIHMRPISELLCDGYFRYDFDAQEGDECGNCHGTNTVRWRLRKLVFKSYTYQHAIECLDCVWESPVATVSKSKAEKRRSVVTFNMKRFQSLPADVQAKLLERLTK